MDFVCYSQGFPLRMEGYFTRQGEAKSLECGSFMHFWTVWKTRNDIVFRDEVLSIQTLKSLFVHLFWSETKVSIVDGPMTLVHFIDWAGA